MGGTIPQALHRRKLDNSQQLLVSLYLFGGVCDYLLDFLPKGNIYSEIEIKFFLP